MLVSVCVECILDEDTSGGAIADVFIKISRGLGLMNLVACQAISVELLL